MAVTGSGSSVAWTTDGSLHSPLLTDISTATKAHHGAHHTAGRRPSSNLGQSPVAEAEPQRSQTEFSIAGTVVSAEGPGQVPLLLPSPPAGIDMAYCEELYHSLEEPW